MPKNCPIVSDNIIRVTSSKSKIEGNNFENLTKRVPEKLHFESPAGSNFGHIAGPQNLSIFEKQLTIVLCTFKSDLSKSKYF